MEAFSAWVLESSFSRRSEMLESSTAVSSCFVMLFPNGINGGIFQLRYFPGEHEDGSVELSICSWVLGGIAG